MCGRFGCLGFKTEWFTGLKVDKNIYLTDAEADAGQSFLMASAVVGVSPPQCHDTKVVLLVVSTTCAACASIKTGTNA